jgi:hypothetical protein
MNGPDPLQFAKEYWPDVTFYREQKEVIYSVCENTETIVHAGNKLGKDFVAGFITLYYFLCYREVRIITTSVRDDHLRVLWGEIGRFIQTCKYCLDVDQGGYPLIVNHHELKKLVNKQECKISYVRGQVSARGEGMAGHHAETALLIVDEASASGDEVYQQAKGWAKKVLAFGNPNNCHNWWRKAIEDGDVELGVPLHVP